jgi:hypothetical protein
VTCWELRRMRGTSAETRLRCGVEIVGRSTALCLHFGHAAASLPHKTCTCQTVTSHAYICDPMHVTPIVPLCVSLSARTASVLRHLDEHNHIVNMSSRLHQNNHRITMSMGLLFALSWTPGTWICATITRCPARHDCLSHGRLPISVIVFLAALGP